MVHAVIRETKEEIGVELNPDDLTLSHVMHRKEPQEERINFFFAAKEWKGEPRILERDKCDDLRWFEPDDLPKNTIPYVRQAITCSRKKIFYGETGW